MWTYLYSSVSPWLKFYWIIFSILIGFIVFKVKFRFPQEFQCGGEREGVFWKSFKIGGKETNSRVARKVDDFWNKEMVVKKAIQIWEALWNYNKKLGDPAECGWILAECVGILADCGWDLAECVGILAECGWDLAECVGILAECGWDLAEFVGILLPSVDEI
jgi:hypothetical protein